MYTARCACSGPWIGARTWTRQGSILQSQGTLRTIAEEFTAIYRSLGTPFGNCLVLTTHQGPNVIVVMVDDQDLRLDSMSVMPQVKRLIGEEVCTRSQSCWDAIYTRTPVG